MTEGVLLLIVPAVGYWFVYLYELGFCKYFDIPASLIDIALIQVLNAIASLLIASFYIYAFTNMLTDSTLLSKLSKYGRRFKFNIIKDIVLISGVIAFMIILKVTSIAVLLSVALTLFGVVYVDFLLPIINFRKTTLSYEEKNNLQVEIDREFSSKHTDLGDKFIEKYGFRAFEIIFLFAVFSVATYLIGGLSAVFKTDYIVYTETKDVEEYAVLRHYNSSFISVKFDRETKNTFPNYKIIHINEDNQEFRIEKIGPLFPYNITLKEQN